MITDVLKNAHLYETLNKQFKPAFEYLRHTDFSELANGKYEIDTDKVFAIINEFETKDKLECEVEAHRKHIDIQYVVKGTELFGYAPLTTQKPLVEYNEANDLTIYKEDVSYIKLEAGSFIIFYPTDLHQPEVCEFQPMTVKKVVVKIKM